MRDERVGTEPHETISQDHFACYSRVGTYRLNISDQDAR